MSIQARDVDPVVDVGARPLKLLDRRTELKIAIVGFGNFGQFLARTFTAQGHELLAYSRTDHSATARSLGFVSSMTSMNSASSTRTSSSSPRPSYPPRPCSGLCPSTAFTAARFLLTSSPSRSSRGTSFCSVCRGTLTSFARIPCSAPKAERPCTPSRRSYLSAVGKSSPRPRLSTARSNPKVNITKVSIG
ncbi:hypothetical protein C4D60_Mb09t08260 [Musa balbisiana]|uniref:Pyrroline-5-carboxylate reductase catalytic N-terminal domain-containing protein n=1 Tax=Musa balbisiana TaxID=52838 RepID=A0A4S8IEV6_MUSBA|nr:hypothetical protein C4D60_Mb09t08260 [Musa balbisiana]